jgi:hypothetical protein
MSGRALRQPSNKQLQPTVQTGSRRGARASFRIPADGLVGQR